MPLKKGNTNIGAIYKGTTQIAKIYKGTTLLFENAKWLDYLFNYLYHSLIPTTIDNKTVQDKARLTKIEGNGVVENQLADLGNIQVNEPDYCSASVSNNVLTMTVIQSISSGTNVRFGTKITAGHKYFYAAKIKATVNNCRILLGLGFNEGYYTDISINQGETKLATLFITANSNDTTSFVRFDGSHSAGSQIEVSELKCIDLTLMFGTGNEPTDINDNRIQALLNRGYIAYNTGSYKNSKVSEIETFDSSNQLLDTITLSGLLELNGAINSHDTFEITNAGYVFTRNVGVVDLGSLSWSYSDNSFSAKLVHKNSGPSRVSNMCCDKYITRINGSSYDIDKALFSANNSYIRIRDDSFNGDYSAFATAMSGVMLYYELATPQVITIPKKHLGCVDLGTLGLSLNGGFWRATITNIKIPATTSTQANIYCNVYLNDSYSHLQSQGYMAVSDSGMIYIKDSTKTQASDFSGVYLFYETDAEVSDFDNIAQINAGGSITSNSEVLPNVNFEIKCK